ncbi:MAG TPA: hypothetical protein VEQ85_05460 [Lacipirellulaceae bacterium]|nr:hypothetical protein [Lacipirellulaceae bacterium]
MTADHFDRTWRACQGRAPFRGFVVDLAGGRQFRVEHPEAVVSRGDDSVSQQSA